MADPSLLEILRALEHAAPIVRASQYLTLSGFAFLLYDYSLTFHQEVELIWKAPKSNISIIFLANRYIVPLMLAVDIYDRLGLANRPSHSVSFEILLWEFPFSFNRFLIPCFTKFCNTWVWLEAYLTLLSFMSLHGLVAMRVHALFGGRELMKIFLWATWVVYAASTLVLLSIGLSHGQATLTVEPYFNVCYEEISSMLWTVWLPSLFLESLLFFLTILKAIREAKENVYHPISSILYRDGILYFLVFAVATLFCMFVWMLGSSEYEGLAKYWSTAVVNVAGSRLILSLKTNARAFKTAKDRSRALVGQSSSFVIGTMWTFSDPQLKDSRCGMSDDLLLPYDDAMSYEMSQIGTVYPDEVKTHWDAL